MTIKVETDETRAEEAKAKKEKEKAKNPVLNVKDIVRVFLDASYDGIIHIYFDFEHNYLRTLKTMDYLELKIVTMSFNELKELYENGEVTVAGDSVPETIKMNRDYKFVIQNILTKMILNDKED